MIDEQHFHIQLDVQMIRGMPPSQPLQVCFDSSGGTIGRAATNALVLNDSDRTVSRVHAQVVCREGRYYIIDRGSNPLQCNGRTLGAGNESPLSDGDQLTIGSYELVVRALADTTASSAAGSSARSASTVANGLYDPFSNLLAGLGTPPAASAAPESVALPESMAPPPLDDLLAPPPTPATPLGLDPQPSRNPGALDDFCDIIAPAAQNTPSIDSLFSNGLGDDSLALSPLAALMGGTAPLARASNSDHLPVGQFAFVPPVAIDTAPAAAPPAPIPPTPPAVAQATPPPTVTTPRADNDVLLAALLRGLRELRNPPEALTPGLMERIGTLLHDAVQGTLQLLLTRLELKRELRAEVTMIASQANNPLKFSPTVEVALAHLLGPGMRGFMPAGESVRDAFNDLRAHQFGIMVGIRAALAQLIARFTPDELKKKIVAKSALDSLFVARRKAKLWDQFVQIYAEIAAEAEDDFHSVFGKAFTQAYEEQMARIKPKNSGRPLAMS
ncbi:MAG: type VI secretion system-associated FHA domain protein TagH [Betaproteobacteria bacterium]|nr:type VI secretion system-associated FHA domain protein TagH [Betaproteobacteria bacterium]